MADRNNNQNFSLKDGVNIDDILRVDPRLLELLSYFVAYSMKYNLPCVLTSIMDDAPGRVSRTHAEGRAFDASVKGWTEQHIYRFVYKTNQKFEHIGAISASDGKSRALVYHDAGTGNHFHFQVRRNL